MITQETVYIMRFILRLNAGPRSHCDQISRRGTNLSRSERTNPRLLIALKIHTSVSLKFQTNTHDCALLENTLRCFTPIYRRELCFPFASKISVFFSSQTRDKCAYV